jgi:hypothetical protein
MPDPIALAALAMLAAVPPPAPRPPYAEGQVWEYRTRPGDEESVVKIQKIGPYPADPEGGLVYHISIYRVTFGPGKTATIWHAPVAKRTLDASLTGLSDKAVRPGHADEEIAEWSRGGGGVITATVAEIAGLAADAVAAGALKPD